MTKVYPLRTSRHSPPTDRTEKRGNEEHGLTLYGVRREEGRQVGKGRLKNVRGRNSVGSRSVPLPMCRGSCTPHPRRVPTAGRGVGPYETVSGEETPTGTEGGYHVTRSGLPDYLRVQDPGDLKFLFEVDGSRVGGLGWYPLELRGVFSPRVYVSAGTQGVVRRVPCRERGAGRKMKGRGGPQDLHISLYAESGVLGVLVGLVVICSE